MATLPLPADAGDPRVFRMSLVHRVLVTVVLGAMSAVGLVTVVGQLIDGHSIFVPLILFLAVVAFLWWQALMVQPIEISVFADGRLDVRCALRTVHHHVRDASTVQFRNQRVTFVISGRRLSPIVADPRELALALLAVNPMIRTVGRSIVPIDAERKRANRRLGRWMMVPWTVAIVGAVSTKFGLEHVGKWMFLGGWLVMMPMLVVAMRHER